MPDEDSCGYELIYDFPQSTPVIMVLSTHFTRASDVIVPDYLTTSPSVPISPYRDVFGNWCSRIVAPPGRMRLAADGVIRDLPDVVASLASQHAVEDLPAETSIFLLVARKGPTSMECRAHSVECGRMRSVRPTVRPTCTLTGHIDFLQIRNGACISSTTNPTRASTNRSHSLRSMRLHSRDETPNTSGDTRFFFLAPHPPVSARTSRYSSSSFPSLSAASAFLSGMDAHENGEQISFLLDGDWGKLIKIGAKIVSHGCYVAFQMDEVAILRTSFADNLRPIAELRSPTVSSTV
jgi:hypothetical protein